MKKTAYILTAVILIIVIWACSDYERTNPFDPGWGKPDALTKLELTAEKIDRIKIVWDDDYYSKDSNYTFQLDRKIGESGIWQEKYKIFSNKTNSFTDSSAGIAETNYYRIRVAYDENLSAPKESYIFTEFYPPAGIFYVMKNLNTIQLNWSDNSNGEDGFLIDRFSGGSWADSIAVLAGNSETWIDSAVVMNDSVQYRICAFRKGIYSDQAISPMINTKISAPGNFIYEFVNIYTIKFTWTDNSTGEDGFKIEKKVALGPWTQVAALPSNSVTWTDNYAEVGEVIQYRIYAYKGSDTSDIVEAPGFNNPFPPPSNLVLNQMDLNTMRLDWSDNSIGEEGFKIDKRDQLGNWNYDIVTVGADVTTWTDTPTDVYDTLAYRVKAYRVYATSNFTEATMNDIAFPPPTDLLVTRESLSRLKFDWTDNSAGEDGFVIDKKIDSDSWIISYGTVVSDVVTWTDSLANIDHDLQYRIYGRSGSNFSNYLVSDIIDNRIPAPSGLGYEKLSINSIRLNWTDNSIDEHGFTIDKAVNGNWTTGYASAGRNSVSWTDISAEINKDIVYRIRAYYSTDYSDAVDTGIITNTFPAPSNLEAVVNGMNITLNWTDNSNGEQGFIISKKYDGQVWDDNYTTVAGNIVTWTETVADTGKYYYRVKAYYGTDQSAVSNVTETWIQQAENEMILVPAGTFQMGQVGVAEPVHQVTISHSFYMAKYETTQKEWTDIMGTNPAQGYGVGDNYPVYYVSWYDILVYCNKRSIAEGINPCYVINGSTDPNTWGSVPTAQDATWDAVECRWYENGYRLPTEAEWEYAARHNDGRTYPWGNTTPDATNCNYNSNVNATTIVGNYPTGNSKLGLCDLAGNMMEYVWDGFENFNSNSQVDPVGPLEIKTNRVVKGGSWGNIDLYIKSTSREYFNASSIFRVYGFRVARNNPADPRPVTFFKAFTKKLAKFDNMRVKQTDDEGYVILVGSLNDLTL
jgi:formylglycine-generating enzyme required for sulfatase activity